MARQTKTKESQTKESKKTKPTAKRRAIVSDKKKKQPAKKPFKKEVINKVREKVANDVVKDIPDETMEEKAFKDQGESVNYILSVSNDAMNNIPHKWKVVIIFVVIFMLVLITFFRLKDVFTGTGETRQIVTEVRNDFVATEINVDKTAADLISEARKALSDKGGTVDTKTLQADLFDLKNATFVIEGETVSLDSGSGTMGDKAVTLENITYQGDFNNDGEDDVVCILSANDNSSVSWYLSAIYGGDERIIVPAKKIGTNYPIVSGISGGENSDEIFVVETEWKEQKTNVRNFIISETEIEEN